MATSTLFILTEQPSVANHYLAQLRDKTIQKDSFRFRKNLERIGEVMAYDVSKTLHYGAQNVETPLGVHNSSLIEDKIVLATVLRAGLPFYQGFLNAFDWAESAFIAAYRTEEEGQPIEVQMDYLASPDLEGKTLILVDPMLATGKSVVTTCKALFRRGKPASFHIVAAIGSRQGVEYVREHLPQAHLWVGDVDEMLNQKSYIVPGLGDAGDLSFGTKL